MIFGMHSLLSYGIVLAIMHLRKIMFLYFLVSVHSFFIYFLKS